MEERGYLLPVGDATELDLGCLIVFYPDRDEYRRALFGSLEYLSTWLAWERDVDKRGKDAAASWKLALDATKECFDMGFCDILLGRLDTIIDILNDGICCAEQDVTDGQRYTDPVTDGVGDVPQPIIDSGWATDVDDWDGFNDYKCVVSHIMVESMEETLRELLEHVDSNGTIIGGIATLAAVLAAIVATGGATIIFGMIGAVGAAATIWRGIASLLDDGLESLADEVLANHDELACVIYNADGVEGALVALGDKIDELFGVTEALVLKNLNIGPRLRGLYGGRYDQQDIAQTLVDAGYTPSSFDCTCMLSSYSISDAFGASKPAYWSGVATWENVGNPPGSLLMNSQNETAYIQPDELMTEKGLTVEPGDLVYVVRIEFDYFSSPSGIPRLIKRINGNNTVLWTDSATKNQWNHHIEEFDPSLELDPNTPTQDFVYVENNYSGSSNFYLDNFIIYYDVVKG